MCQKSFGGKVPPGPGQRSPDPLASGREEIGRRGKRKERKGKREKREKKKSGEKRKGREEGTEGGCPLTLI